MSFSIQPLADKMRPKTLDDVFGQKHLLGKNKPIRIMYEKKILANMIFSGPPGIGKTTVAMIMAENTGLDFYKINATNSGTKEIQEILDKNKGKSVVLYIDEIQYFNKKQQQSLLEYVETGRVVLIASTTENPSFYIYDALLSRCHTFEFKPLDYADMLEAIESAIKHCDILKPDAINDYGKDFIIDYADGDVRKAINLIELIELVYDNTDSISVQDITSVADKKMLKHDKDGDNHYDLLSAFQKSIRGSDPDASLHYLARLISGGDVKAVCRRLLVIASEDIGLADPRAISVVNGCTEAAMKLGMPEARIPLAEAVIYLAMSPKSNSAIMAIDAAIEDLNKGLGEIPDDLKDSHYITPHGKGYKYPHSYPNHWVKQRYLPEIYGDAKYYVPQDNVEEEGRDSYMKFVKKQNS